MCIYTHTHTMEYSKFNIHTIQFNGLCSLQGSSVHGIFQARILEGVGLPTPGDLSKSGIKPMSLASPAMQMDSLSLRHQESP